MAQNLPTVDLEAQRARRRQEAAEARLRRVQRERDLADQLATWLGGDLIERVEFREQITLTVTLKKLHAALEFARDSLGYDMLTDITAMDWLKWETDKPERFSVVYTMTHTQQEARLIVQAYVPEDEPVVPTASDLWPAADWAEREVYDMFGIEFEGHPNLIRLLMPHEYSGYPLRKDYPLRGRGERDNFPVLRREKTS